MSSVGPLRSPGGNDTSVRAVASGFLGGQTGGSSANDFGWPGAVSRDSLYVGSATGHTEALANPGIVQLLGLAPGTYEVRIFASRDGNDGGVGRLTRYRVGEQIQDLEAADNRSMQVAFEVSPNESGQLVIEVNVSPDGLGRYGYLGALVVSRLE